MATLLQFRGPVLRGNLLHPVRALLQHGRRAQELRGNLLLLPSRRLRHTILQLTVLPSRTVSQPVRAVVGANCVAPLHVRTRGKSRTLLLLLRLALRLAPRAFGLLRLVWVVSPRRRRRRPRV